MPQIINSKENARVKYAYSLKQKKNREENRCFLIEGEKILKMAIASNRVKEVFSIKELDYLPKDIPLYIVNESIIDKLCFSKNPEGVVAICSIEENKTKKDYNKVVYLDDINDPGNMGTIIRTALAFGYDAVISSKDSVDFYNEKVIASSKGSIFSIEVLKGNLKDFKEKYQIIVSTLSDKSIDVNAALKEVKRPFVLVLGNEAHGASKESTSLADLLVKIPMDKIESLNVGVAAGILMYLL